MAFVSGDRRRRVLTEQLAAGAAASAENASAAASTPTVSPAAALGPAYEPDTLSRLARVTDLVPHRTSFFVLWWLALVLLGAGLVTLHIYSPGWSKWLSAESLTTLDLTAPTGLGRWFSTVLLLIAASLSGLIYAVRRHRTDDYQGRYRLWATAGLCWLLLSLFSSTGTGEIVREVGVRYTAWQGWRAGTFWWLVPLATIYGIALLRMSLDMVRAPLAFGTLSLATASWLGAMSIEFGWLNVSFAPAPLLQAGLMMAGHLLLVAALLSYARLVVLQAAGKIAAVAIPRKKKDSQTEKKKRRTRAAAKPTAKSKTAAKADKPAERKATTSKDEDDEEEDFDRLVRRNLKPAASTPARPATSGLSIGSRDEDDEDDSEDEDSLDGRQKLSKADRKRLRRERTKENRAA